MVEFFNNLLVWVTSHLQQILLFLTTTSLGTVILNTVVFVKKLPSLKSSKEDKDKTASVLTECSSAIDKVKSIEKKFESLYNCFSKFEQNVKNFESSCESKFSEVTEKIGAMLKVQSIVYSTINDETIRKNVNGILQSAECYSTNKQAELEAELALLKQKVSDKLNEAKEVAKEVQEVANKYIDEQVEVEETLPRY